MFRFSIRDVLWLTLVVALGAMWFANRNGWQKEREALLSKQEALLLQRDKDVENERRLGLLRAREAAGSTVSRSLRPAAVPARPPRRPVDESPIIEVPLVR